MNIASGVVLLLVAIYVSDALKIAPFSTLLLLTTLFRLALEVSATRLILLRADAGEVIRAFGNFVVAGNLVVGAVVFLVSENRALRQLPGHPSPGPCGPCRAPSKPFARGRRAGRGLRHSPPSPRRSPVSVWRRSQ